MKIENMIMCQEYIEKVRELELEFYRFYLQQSKYGFLSDKPFTALRFYDFLHSRRTEYLHDFVAFNFWKMKHGEYGYIQEGSDDEVWVDAYLLQKLKEFDYINVAELYESKQEGKRWDFSDNFLEYFENGFEKKQWLQDYINS